MRGEFEVIKELLEKVPETKAGKVLADKMIDICGTPPEGAGMQNLRKIIIQMKYKYDASTEDEHSDLKSMIAEGKDKLEWTRKVDQSRVDELRNKLAGPDFKENLGLLVSDLYKLAFQTYHDI